MLSRLITLLSPQLIKSWQLKVVRLHASKFSLVFDV